MANGSHGKAKHTAAPRAVPAAHTIRPRMPDGVALEARRHDPAGHPRALAVLLPDLGEDHTVFDGAAARLAGRGIRAFAISHRGHGKSGGTWSLSAQLRDYRAWLWTLQNEARTLSPKKPLPVIVIARGLCATLALLHEEIAHRHPVHRRPAVPDGMVLLEPVLHGHARLPRGFFASFGGRVGACRNVSRAQRGVLRRFRLPPVRTQTPAFVVVSGSLHEINHDDPLRRVFGNARIRRGSWLHPVGDIALAHFDKEVADLCDEAFASDKPHRFRVVD
jgi:hypothetical protein